MKKYAIPFLLVFVGIVDIILRCYNSDSVGFGLKYSLFDPGKSLFHLIILPIGVHLYLSRFPPRKSIATFNGLIPANKILLLVFGIGLAALGLGFGYQNDANILCRSDYKEDAHVMPYDIKENKNLDSLILFREKAYASISRFARTGNADDAAQKEAAIANYERLSKPPTTPPCSVITYASSYMLWSIGETQLSIFFVAILVCTMLMVSLSPANNRKSIDNLIVIALVLCPWLFLRLYSESYINFSSIDKTHAIGIIFFVVVLISFLITGMLSRKSKKSFKKVIVTTYTIIAAIVGIIASITPESIREPFVFIYSTGVLGTLLFFVLLMIPLTALLAKNPEDFNPLDDDDGTADKKERVPAEV